MPRQLTAEEIASVNQEAKAFALNLSAFGRKVWEKYDKEMRMKKVKRKKVLKPIADDPSPPGKRGWNMTEVARENLVEFLNDLNKSPYVSMTNVHLLQAPGSAVGSYIDVVFYVHGAD